MPLQCYYSTVKEQSQQMHTPNGQLGLQISCKNHEKSGQASQFGGRYQPREIALQILSTNVDYVVLLSCVVFFMLASMAT